MEQENLHSLREQVARQAQLRSRERSLKSQLPALKAREEELAAARSKEQTDVDKLEGGSLKAYFLRFTGGLEDRLDQERAEAAQAAVRHDMVCRELASVQADLESAQTELASLAGCEERYRAALEEKARQLQDAGGPMGERLRELEARTRVLTGQLRELREALEAGEAARATADGIRSSLDSAEGWGTFDGPCQARPSGRGPAAGGDPPGPAAPVPHGAGGRGDPGGYAGGDRRILAVRGFLL